MRAADDLRAADESLRDRALQALYRATDQSAPLYVQVQAARTVLADRLGANEPNEVEDELRRMLARYAVGATGLCHCCGEIHIGYGERFEILEKLSIEEG